MVKFRGIMEYLHTESRSFIEMFADLFSDLGIPIDAFVRDVRSAVKRVANMFHPDWNENKRSFIPVDYFAALTGFAQITEKLSAGAPRTPGSGVLTNSKVCVCSA